MSISIHGVEWTSQPFLTELQNTIACLVCKKAITTRCNAWFDNYVENPYNEKKKGGYVCKEHLSQQRKDEINADRPPDSPENFEDEKNWVNTTQTDSGAEGPLMGLLLASCKYPNDPVIQNGIKSIIKAKADLNKE